jgi:hypothetical protein
MSPETFLVSSPTCVYDGLVLVFFVLMQRAPADFLPEALSVGNGSRA